MLDLAPTRYAGRSPDLLQGGGADLRALHLEDRLSSPLPGGALRVGTFVVSAQRP